MHWSFSIERTFRLRVCDEAFTGVSVSKMVPKECYFAFISRKEFSSEALVQEKLALHIRLSQLLVFLTKTKLRVSHPRVAGDHTAPFSFRPLLATTPQEEQRSSSHCVECTKTKVMSDTIALTQLMVISLITG